jgi:acetoacetate decarboxylase
MKTMSNNIPLHNPLFPPSMQYGSDDGESLSILLQVEEAYVRKILAPTPFSFVSAHAWIEVVVLRSAWGIQPFCGGGIIIPARYHDTVGGYYAYCYIDTDEALALGREPFGYPKKYAQSFVQKTGRAVVAAMRRNDAAVEVSVIIGSEEPRTVSVPRYPHLLLQTFPSAQSDEALLTRVIARDTSRTSTMASQIGEAAISIPMTSIPNELEWLRSGLPLSGSYARGSFQGALGVVLGTEHLGSELRSVLTTSKVADAAE